MAPGREVGERRHDDGVDRDDDAGQGATLEEVSPDGFELAPPGHDPADAEVEEQDRGALRGDSADDAEEGQQATQREAEQGVGKVCVA